MDDLTEDFNATHEIPKHMESTWRMEELLDQYARWTGNGDDGDATVLVDLLADLMHWADAFRVGFYSCVSSAEFHHQAEMPSENKNG